jgi:FMN phosphatase YigB (HAD superfamily)
MKVQPKNALYVGDVFALDVTGPQNAGMHAALLDPFELYEIKEAENFLLIRTLSELTRIKG